MHIDKVKHRHIQSGNLTNKYEQVWYNGRYDKNSQKPIGLGKRFYSNGDYLIGEFKDGKPQKGCLYVLRDRKLYEGNFVQGLLEGQVTEREEDDNVSDLEFLRGVPKNQYKQVKQEQLLREYISHFRKDLLKLQRLQRVLSYPTVAKNKVYLSSYNLLLQVNNYPSNSFQETELFLKEHCIFNKFDYCIFAGENGIVKFDCRTGIARYYCQEQSESKISWQFMDYFAREMEDKFINEKKKITSEIFIPFKQTKEFEKLSIGLQLKWIIFQLIHEIPLEHKRNFQKENFKDFELEATNIILYDRCCLELTTENLHKIEAEN